MKLNKKWLIAGGLAVLVAIFAIAAVKRQSGKVSAVEWTKVRRETVVSHVKAPGTIEPFTLVKMSATLSGRVTYLGQKEGDRVRRGEVLLRLDATEYEADLRRASAMLAASESRMEQARLNLDRSRQNLDRRRQLAAKNLVSADEMEQVETQHKVAQSEFNAAREAVGEAQASRAASQDRVSKTIFTAPFDGVLTQVNVEVGENVIPGTMNNPGTQILSVADTSRMIVRARVDETDIVDVRVAQKVKIKVDAYPDSVFEGEVVEVGSSAKISTSAAGTGQNNFEIKVIFKRQVRNIRQGMTADVDVETNSHPSVLAVPIQCVVVRTERELEQARLDAQKGVKKSSTQGSLQDEDEATRKRKDKEVNGMFLVNKDRVRFVRVTQGISSDVQVEVAGEIKEGDLVVSGPYKELRSLKDGDHVKHAQEKKGEKKN